MDLIDLRSDTLTQPTDSMRQAMAEAKVGDDVFGEDPTINKLEAVSAKKLGKEAALFVPSGTMGNLISVLTHCGRGDEILLGDRSHIFLNEVGGISALGGVHPHIVPNNSDGTLPLDLLEKAIRHEELHYPPTRLICLENTHNYCQGNPLTPAYMQEVGALARKHSLKIHLDGARIFNAAIALDVDVSTLAKDADSVIFCLSKGLSAPVGSLVCGTGPFIQTARKMRKMVGGGMRQAGHLAAAGLVSLECLVERLQEDHQNAQELASGLTAIKAIDLDRENVKTNILFFRVNHPKIQPDNFLKRLEAEGIKILLIEPGVFRAVVHRNISREQIRHTVEVAKKHLGE